MADNKTKPTDQNVADFVASLPLEQQTDARALTELMRRVSGERPVMWGAKIVGFGYRNEWPRISFAPGSGKFSLYLTDNAEELTSRVTDLGKYRNGKGCIYINKLADVDLGKLEELIEAAYVETHIT